MNMIFRILLSLLLIFSTLPIIHTNANAETSETDYIVAASILNLREGPGLTFPIMKELKKGDEITKFEKKGDWVQVSHEGTKGWVAAWLIKAKTTEQVNVVNQTVISKVDHLNIRKEPSISAAVLSQLFTGDKATYIQQSGDWVEIQLNNFTGWVHQQYVVIEQAPTNPKQEENLKEEDEVSIENMYFTVEVSAINIRKKPDLNSKKLGTIKQNEQYLVLAKEHNWIQIEYEKNKKGWVYSFYGTMSTSKITKSEKPATKEEQSDNTVQIIYDGTNLRSEPDTNSKIVKRAKIGETFTVLSAANDWYEIKVGNEKAYVASWVVKSTDKSTQNSVNNVQKETKKEQRKKGSLKGLTIVIDPGHGGNDHGTTGVSGTPEKSINSKTAELLTNKLRSAGAEVILTRESDIYVGLRKRVSISNQHNADAFISIHYDASDLSSVKGFTTYYTNSNQKALAEAVHKGLSKRVSLRDRGVQPGNYLVLRENSKPSILLELGYLSNRDEERVVTTDYFREQATQGIYEGLLHYFDAQLD